MNPKLSTREPATSQERFAVTQEPQNALQKNMVCNGAGCRVHDTDGLAKQPVRLPSRRPPRSGPNLHLSNRKWKTFANLVTTQQQQLETQRQQMDDLKNQMQELIDATKQANAAAQKAESGVTEVQAAATKAQQDATEAQRLADQAGANAVEAKTSLALVNNKFRCQYQARLRP